MADVILNRALGKIHQYADNVDSGSPANAVIRLFCLSVTGDQDNAIRDLSTMTMTGLFALSNVAESTNTGYANQSMADADITITIDDTNNRIDIQGGDQTFSSVDNDGTGDITDIVFAYDDDGSDTNSNTIPLSKHDFAVTPSGGDITADEPAIGFSRCAG